MKKYVLMHTNERQWLGAQLSACSMRRNSAHADEFDVEFIHVRDYLFLQGREGQPFLREEMKRNHVRHDALEVAERTPPLAV